MIMPIRLCSGVRDARDAQRAARHALAQQLAGAADDALQRAFGRALFLDGAAQLVVLEQRAQQQARVRRLARRAGRRSCRSSGRAAPPASRRRPARASAPPRSRQDALDHRGIELGLGGEVMEERRLAEARPPRRSRSCRRRRSRAARTAPPRRRGSCRAAWIPRRVTRIDPTDRSVELYRSIGRLSRSLSMSSPSRSVV